MSDRDESFLIGAINIVEELCIRQDEILHSFEGTSIAGWNDESDSGNSAFQSTSGASDTTEMTKGRKVTLLRTSSRPLSQT